MSQTSIEDINKLIKSLKDSGFLKTKDLADRYYTIQELYEHRLTLFKIIAHTYSNLAWKTKIHHDGSMFDDSFLAGINTPLGNATYHFKLQHYNEFNIPEIPSGPQYDGYTPDDVLKRLNSLPLLDKNYTNTGANTSLTHTETLKDSDKEKLAKIINELVSTLQDMDLIRTAQLNDGNHTLKELYKQKRELFKIICHNYKDLAWKSNFDINETELPENTFFAGINTPQGPVCYVLNNEYYNDFNVNALDFAPISKDNIYDNVITKLSSINIRNKALAKSKDEDYTR